jgi:hypothetical protein
MEATKKIAVLQADNRINLDYLYLTQSVNKKVCKQFNYEYLFLDLNYADYGDIFPATKKIYAVNDTINYTDFDIIIFLDSDAWIQNGYWLNDVIKNLINDDKKNGCFSRDPYLKINTYINSGSFIIKNNDYTKNMYKNIITNLESDKSHHSEWPFDQYYISDYIHKNRTDFTIFVPDILNTPTGKILRHNWHKNIKMYFDLSCLDSNIDKDSYINKSNFEQDKYYDEEEFPNTLDSAYEYLL